MFPPTTPRARPKPDELLVSKRLRCGRGKRPPVDNSFLPPDKVPVVFLFFYQLGASLTPHSLTLKESHTDISFPASITDSKETRQTNRDRIGVSRTKLLCGKLDVCAFAADP